MASIIEICNMALSHCHNSKRITDFSDKTNQANLCSTFFYISRDAILEAHPWNFCKKISSLALIEKNPTATWGYSYAMPSDCIKTLYIDSGIRNARDKDLIRFQIYSGDTSPLIYTDQENASLVYVKKNENPSQYPPTFTLALSYLLALNILPGLMAGNADRKEILLKYYQLYLSQAKKHDLESIQRDSAPKSEFVTVRN